MRENYSNSSSIFGKKWYANPYVNPIPPRKTNRAVRSMSLRYSFSVKVGFGS